MLTINDILIELRSNNSSKYKMSVLEKYKDNELFQRVLSYTYNPYVQYHLKQVPEYVDAMNETGTYNSLESALDFLDKLSERVITGNEAKGTLSVVIDHLSPSDAEVIRLVLDRNLDCGISEKTINKIIPNLIPEIPYMRCEKSTEKTLSKIKFPAVVQLKADGSFINIIKHNKNVYCMTRNGTLVYISKVSEFFQNITHDEDNFVLMGEIVLFKDGKPLPRKTGNGLINSYAKREATRQSILDKQKALVKSGKGASTTFKKLSNELHTREEDWKLTESMMEIDVWDYVPYDKWKECKYDSPYTVRFEQAQSLVKECPFMNPIMTIKIDSLVEATTFARNMMNQGLEGGVVKNLHGIWEDGTSKDQIKLKDVIEADLIIVDYLAGEGDFTGGIGALIGKTSDGLLISSVSSGLTREDRGLERVDEEDMAKGLRFRSDYKSIDDFFEAVYKNQIMAVKANALSKSDENDYWTLSHPVYIEVRTDKNYADTLERLQGDNIEN